MDSIGQYSIAARRSIVVTKYTREFRIKQVKFNLQHSGNNYIVKLKSPKEFPLIENIEDCNVYNDCYVYFEDTHAKLEKTEKYTYSSNSINPDYVSKKIDLSFRGSKNFGSFDIWILFHWFNHGNIRACVEYQVCDSEGYAISWSIYGKEFDLRLYENMSMFKAYTYNTSNGKLKNVTSFRD